MKVNLIAAVALNGAIGRNGDLIWHLSADLKYFKATTMGHPVIMGRKTFESIGRALPGRLNIVISRGEPTLSDGVVLVHSLEEALEKVRTAGETVTSEPFVIGGGQIYADAVKYILKNRLDANIYLTRIFCNPEDADTFFPPIEADSWEIISQSEISHDEASGLDYRFETYRHSR